MPAPTDGATYGDAIICAINFAEKHPYRFILTVPCTLAIGLAFAVFISKYVVAGQIIHHKESYDRRRHETSQALKTKGTK